MQKLNSSSKQLRAHVFGQDRYWRRYWELPCAGGIFIEAMESAEPEIIELQHQLDEKYANMPEEDEPPPAKRRKEMEDTENRENEAPNEVKEEKKTQFKEEDEIKKEEKRKDENEVKMEVDEVNCKKEVVVNNCSEDGKESEEPKEEVKQEVKTETPKKETECEKEKVGEEKVQPTLPNGDKFNHVNHLPKELNGNVVQGKIKMIFYSGYFFFFGVEHGLIVRFVFRSNQ